MTPLSLSIETLGGVATALIERNTTIPTRKTQVFSTASDNQSEVEIHVVQGERPMAADNKSLGKFTLDGLPPSPRGVPQIDVTFDIDADGILKVSATDQATGRSQHITITASSGLTESEIDRMRNDAERFAEEDQIRRSHAEARNAADNAIYSAEKALLEGGRRIPSEMRAEVEAKILEARAKMELQDSGGKAAEDLRRTTNQLLELLSKIGADVAHSEGTPMGGRSRSGEEVSEGDATGV